ncbi:hypothetical protein ACOMHN_040930 [Nucella lapillus]
MDKFPARPQTNPWTTRQQANSSLKASPFTTPSRVGATSGHPVFDSVVSALPDRLHHTINQSGKRPGAALSRKGPKLPTASEADQLFKMKMVEKCAQMVLSEKLKDVAYDPNNCRDICPDLASAILNKIRGFSLQQYKTVCVVSLGSLKEKPGVQFGSRCLWNKDTDSFVNVKYSNGSVYAVALIFGLYFD